VLACDLHPDYLSTRFAQESGLPVVAVQHHHAHIAAVLAEYGLDEPIIGVSFDGTGLGADGHIWGGEFLICDLDNYQRFTHLAYMPMPGGDKAAIEPWRMGLAYLYHTFGRDFLMYDLPFLKTLTPRQIEIVLAAIDKGLNCPLTSSLGRLFDAIAAIINLVTINSFEAEAPIRLEALIEPVRYQQRPREHERYAYVINETVSMVSLIREIVNDVCRHVPTSTIALKFHNTLIALIVDVAAQMRRATGLNKVALSGGVFQNRYLLGQTEERLTESGFNVYSPIKVPANDGGLCLGQLVIAAKNYRN
jgi:hydrogenase maturation protein HypF